MRSWRCTGPQSSRLDVDTCRDAREKAWLRDLYNRTFTVLQPFFMRTLLQPFSNHTTVRTTLNLFPFYGTVNGKVIFLSSTLRRDGKGICRRYTF